MLNLDGLKVPKEGRLGIATRCDSPERKNPEIICRRTAPTQHTEKSDAAGRDGVITRVWAPAIAATHSEQKASRKNNMLACQRDYVSAMAEGKTKAMTEAAKRDDSASHAHLNKVLQAHKRSLSLPLADGSRSSCVCPVRCVVAPIPT